LLSTDLVSILTMVLYLGRDLWTDHTLLKIENPFHARRKKRPHPDVVSWSELRACGRHFSFRGQHCSRYRYCRADDASKAETNFQLFTCCSWLCAWTDGAKTCVENESRSYSFLIVLRLKGQRLPCIRNMKGVLVVRGAAGGKPPSCNVNLMDWTPSDDTNSMERR
jgi:hypothetical protein